MVSEVIINLLKKFIGKRVRFYDDRDFYYEGTLIELDNECMLYNDRKKGRRLINLSQIKEVVL